MGLLIVPDRAPLTAYETAAGERIGAASDAVIKNL